MNHVARWNREQVSNPLSGSLGGVRVGDLEGDQYLLISDSQDRRAVLETLGLEEEASEWPHLFVWAEDGEYVEVWGCRFDVPRLDDPAVPLFPPQELEEPPDDPDWLEAKEWEDFGGPDLPSED